MRKKFSPDRTGIDVDIVAGPIHVAGRHGEAAAADAVSQPFILNIMKDLVSEFKFYGQSSSKYSMSITYTIYAAFEEIFCH